MRKVLNSHSPINAEETACLSRSPNTFSLSDWLSLCRHDHTCSVGMRKQHTLAGGSGTGTQEAGLLGRFLSETVAGCCELGPQSSFASQVPWSAHVVDRLGCILQSCPGKLPLGQLSKKKTPPTPACKFSSSCIQASQTTLYLFLEMPGTRPPRASWETV